MLLFITKGERMKYENIKHENINFFYSIYILPPAKAECIANINEISHNMISLVGASI
jgi:hypothetical protein